MASAPTVNRTELATFLRTRRARLRPSDVGLPDGGGRRTPGLRRQEVAQLAAISIDYYIRLEQGRGPRPSRAVLGALARALLLSADERAYLLHLAGLGEIETESPSRTVPETIRNMLYALRENPAFVLDAAYNVLAWNDLATCFIGNLTRRPENDRNVLRWAFLGNDETYWTHEQNRAFTRSSVADLRAAAARYPGDPGIAALVAELSVMSPRFAALWDEHEVEVRRNVTKDVHHPLIGTVTVECQVLHVPQTDQRLVVYVAPPGSEADEALRRLAAATAGRVSAGALT